MKKILVISFLNILLLNSCGSSNYPVKQPTRKTSNTSTNTRAITSSISQTEREYQALIKTYKPETADVLNSLFTDSSDSQNVSISVENKSNCNMVLTISGNNFSKKFLLEFIKPVRQ